MLGRKRFATPSGSGGRRSCLALALEGRARTPEDVRPSAVVRVTREDEEQVRQAVQIRERARVHLLLLPPGDGLALFPPPPPAGAPASRPPRRHPPRATCSAAAAAEPPGSTKLWSGSSSSFQRSQARSSASTCSAPMRRRWRARPRVLPTGTARSAPT